MNQDIQGSRCDSTAGFNSTWEKWLYEDHYGRAKF